MTCDVCGRKMNYCFYINNEHWLAAVGTDIGHWCAHCILEKLGGLDWWIVLNEPLKRSRESHAEAEREHQSPVCVCGHEVGFHIENEQKELQCLGGTDCRCSGYVWNKNNS